MRNLPSLTAEAVCLARALDRRHKTSRRLLDDPWAQAFLRRPERLALRLATRLPGSRTMEHLLDPGLVASIAARHAWIDEQLLASLPEVQQIIIVGAGYDSRAWRFATQLDGRRVYEVDHPATAKRKARCVRRLAGELPDTRWQQVPTDLRHRRLDDALAQAGVDPSVPTTFIWEGVSMYLTRVQVDDTLRRMVEASGPGSNVILDFWTPTPGMGLLGTGERVGRLGLGVLGEPLRFTLPPHRVPGLLHNNRIKVIQQDTVRSIARRRSGRAAFPDLHMARGRVIPHARTSVSAPPDP